MEVKNSIPVSMAIERSVFEQFVNHTLRYSENEWGGLLISRIINGEIQCIASVLPPQKVQSAGYCEFKKELFPVVRSALEEIESKYHDDNFQIMTWIHTHPGLGVFLSTTDHSTFSYLGKLNPSITAVVVDPIQYDWLAVNSCPGNTYGFTSLDLDLDLLLAKDDKDPKLTEKLEVLRTKINSERNKKMLGLSPTDKIEVFVPIPIDSLFREIISSNLNGISGLLGHVKKKLFATDANITVPTKKEKKPEIQELVNYILQFRGLEREIRSWRSLQVNKQILSIDLTDYAERHQEFIERAMYHMKDIAKKTGGIVAIRISFWDDCLQYNYANASKRVKWSSIKDLEVSVLSEEAHILGISFKKNVLSKWQHLILFVPDFEKLETVLKTKVDYTNGTRIQDTYAAYEERSKENEIKKQERAEKERKAQAKKEILETQKTTPTSGDPRITGDDGKEREKKEMDKDGHGTGGAKEEQGKKPVKEKGNT